MKYAVSPYNNVQPSQARNQWRVSILTVTNAKSWGISGLRERLAASQEVVLLGSLGLSPGHSP